MTTPSTEPLLYPVILTGGSGMRLWPLSRASLPKQLLPLISEHSMLQETILRLDGVPALAPPVIISNSEHRFLVAEQLQQIGVKPTALMLEPVGRETAAALTIGALHLAKTDPDALMLALPADHVIGDLPAFHAAIQDARELAQQGYLVTFGIEATTPETGYGYIQGGEAINGAAYRIAQFVEKPDKATAKQYLQAGDYSWNSGMLLFRASDFLAEVHRLCPQIEEVCRIALDEAQVDLDFLRIGPSLANSPSESVDTAISEKTDKAAVIPIDIGWSDIGSWSALWEYLPKDSEGNVRRGEVLVHDVSNCFIHAETRVVAALGVEDLIVVETPDAVMVAHKSAAQQVKKLVEQLQSSGRHEHEIHKRVYRPWGSYEGVDRGQRFQVKRITVKPQARLSLQKHYHRSEHWVVVSGTAQVTIDAETRLVKENESIYIPLGSVHSLHNPGHIPLDIIEVQSGSYFGEDDIIRLEDMYGRE